MYQGKYVFTQLCEFLPKSSFDHLVDKYEGNKYVKSFTCWNHLLVLIFGQLTHRESLRDLVTTLNAHQEKFHHHDMEEIRERLDQIWQLQRRILLSQR